MTGAQLRGVPVPKTTSPTAMHEFADEQSTPDRKVWGPWAFGVGVTVQAPDAIEGAKVAPRSQTRPGELIEATSAH